VATTKIGLFGATQEMTMSIEESEKASSSPLITPTVAAVMEFLKTLAATPLLQVESISILVSFRSFYQWSELICGARARHGPARLVPFGELVKRILRNLLCHGLIIANSAEGCVELR
jgi:hypothetical protein